MFKSKAGAPASWRLRPTLKAMRICISQSRKLIRLFSSPMVLLTPVVVLMIA